MKEKPLTVKGSWTFREEAGGKNGAAYRNRTET